MNRQILNLSILLFSLLISNQLCSQSSRLDMDGKALMVAQDGFSFHLDFNTNSNSDKFVVLANHGGDVPTVPHTDTLMVLSENRKHRINGELDLTRINVYDSLNMRSGLISSEYGFTFQTDYDQSAFFAPGYTFNVGSITFLTLGPFGTKINGFTEISGACNIKDNLIVNGNVTAACGVLSCSDIRYKKNIQPISNALDNLAKLNGVSYYWKSQDFPTKNFNNKKQIGVIAQELEAVYPELVSTNKEGFKVVAYDKLGPILLEAIKEQMAIINSQKNDIEDMKKDIEMLKSLIKSNN